MKKWAETLQVGYVEVVPKTGDGTKSALTGVIKAIDNIYPPSIPADDTISALPATRPPSCSSASSSSTYAETSSDRSLRSTSPSNSIPSIANERDKDQRKKHIVISVPNTPRSRCDSQDQYDISSHLSL